MPKDERFTVHTNGTLTIQNVQRDDAGDYTLWASNTGGNSSAAIRLVVNCKTATIILLLLPILSFFVVDAPYFVSTPTNLSVIFGDRVVLECSGNGLPSPLVSWSKVVNGVLDDVPTSGSGNQLIFSSVLLSDAGMYACSLRNIIGQVTAFAQLNVTGKA